nr:hypothetical protein [Tanacetum cinerariifolium]
MHHVIAMKYWLFQGKRKLEDASKQRGKIDELDANEDVTLETVDANVLGRFEEPQVKVYHLDLEHTDKVLSMQETDEIEPDEVEQVIKVVIAAKLMTEVATTATIIIIAALVPKDSAPRIRRVVEEEVTGQEEEVSKRKSESSEQREAKKQRIDEEVEELKTHLQILVHDDDDDVYTEATPLALKPRFIMDDPNITMEEYIRLKEEKSQRHDQTFNWQTATYDMAPLPSRDQRHPCLRYQVGGYGEDLVYSYEQRLKTIWGRDEGQELFTSHACKSLFEIRAPLVRVFILEFLSTCKMSDTEIELDVADTGQAPKKVTVSISSIFAAWTEGLLTYLVARFGMVSDQGLRCLSMVTSELPLIDLHKLGRLNICLRVCDTWAWVALAPERQPDVTAGALGSAKMLL